jgi:excisionase family DNA binding protein
MELTLKEVAERTGLSIDNIRKLVARGILPVGRIDNRKRLLPFIETMLIVNSHDFNKHWVKGRPRNTKAKAKRWQELL